jgi:hypothetical protein
MKNSGKQRALSLFFRPRNCWKPRISAGNEISPAVNFMEKERKQREALRNLPPVEPVFDQAAGDRIEARQPECVVVGVRQ